MSVTDLTGTKWLINERPYVAMGKTYSINFISNDTNYIAFNQWDNHDRLNYDSTRAYNTDTKTWTHENYRIVEITGGTDATSSDAITWFTTNATQILPTSYLTTDTELTSIANAIRTKGGTSASLTFPSGFVSAINDISTGTDVSDTTATAADVLSGKNFYLANGTKVSGTIALYDGSVT